MLDKIAMIHAKWCLKRIYIDTRLKKDFDTGVKNHFYSLSL